MQYIKIDTTQTITENINRLAPIIQRDEQQLADLIEYAYHLKKQAEENGRGNFAGLHQ